MSTITTIIHEDHPDGFLRLSLSRCGHAVAAVFQNAVGHIELNEVDIDFLRRAFAAIPSPAPKGHTLEQPRDVASAVASAARQVSGPTLEAAGAGGAGAGGAGAGGAGAVSPKAPQAGKRWTDEEEARMHQLLIDGHSFDDIATTLQRSPAGIISRAILRGMVAVNVTPPTPNTITRGRVDERV